MLKKCFILNCTKKDRKNVVVVVVVAGVHLKIIPFLP
jgi:hypothetical protein